MYTHAITVRLLTVGVSHHPLGEKGGHIVTQALRCTMVLGIQMLGSVRKQTGCNDRIVTRG